MTIYLLLGVIYVIVDICVNAEARYRIRTENEFLTVLVLCLAVIFWLPMLLVGLVKYFGGKI